MKIIDKLQEKKIRVLFGLVAFLGGVTSLLLYTQRKRNSKENKEIMDLEKELRTLQIEDLKMRKEERLRKEKG
jgi:hypothetical protein